MSVDPDRVLATLLRIDDPLAHEAAAAIAQLLVDRQALIREQLEAEFRYEAQLSGWEDIAFSIHRMLTRLSKRIPDERIANAVRTMDSIKRRMAK
jgi:hypothetical protein